MKRRRGEIEVRNFFYQDIVTLEQIMNSNKGFVCIQSPLPENFSEVKSNFLSKGIFAAMIDFSPEQKGTGLALVLSKAKISEN